MLSLCRVPMSFICRVNDHCLLSIHRGAECSIALSVALKSVERPISCLRPKDCTVYTLLSYWQANVDFIGDIIARKSFEIER